MILFCIRESWKTNIRNQFEQAIPIWALVSEWR